MHDSGDHDGTPYIVMARLSGRTLADVLFTHSGVTKIADFGIAKSAETPHTITGQIGLDGRTRSRARGERPDPAWKNAPAKYAVVIVVTWLIVGIPLAYGVFNAVKAALQLFS